MNCRFCNQPVHRVFIDLGHTPVSNSFLSEDQLNEPETAYPLKTMVCETCFLVQIEEYKKATEIFNTEYVYFSSYSTSWLEHAKKYVAHMMNDFGINVDSMVLEIASNDGYLLQYFKEKGIPVSGIEPSASTAKVALEKGIPTQIEFFNTALAGKLAEKQKYDLVLGNNVLAHVPDINDFVEGLKIVLGAEGIITLEFPHLLRLIENNQFDTIYHEHYSYLSLSTVSQIFERHALNIFRVEELPTHGGSLRVFAKHRESDSHPVDGTVEALLTKELKTGIASMGYYTNFGKRANKIKLDFLEFLVEARKRNKKVIAYGAAAKGNTFLNFCGIKRDLIDYIVDAAPSKQGKYLPGSHIQVVTEEEIKATKPDYIIILPWNLRDEIINQLNYVRDWDAKFVVAIPSFEMI